MKEVFLFYQNFNHWQKKNYRGIYFKTIDKTEPQLLYNKHNPSFWNFSDKSRNYLKPFLDEKHLVFLAPKNLIIIPMNCDLTPPFLEDYTPRDISKKNTTNFVTFKNKIFILGSKNFSVFKMMNNMRVIPLKEIEVEGGTALEICDSGRFILLEHECRYSPGNKSTSKISIYDTVEN